MYEMPEKWFDVRHFSLDSFREEVKCLIIKYYKQFLKKKDTSCYLDPDDYLSINKLELSEAYVDNLPAFIFGTFRVGLITPSVFETRPPDSIFEITYIQSTGEMRIHRYDQIAEVETITYLRNH